METAGLVAELLTVDPAGRRALLQSHRHEINLQLIEALKAVVDEQKLQDPLRAVETAAVALEAATLCADPLAIPLALWARGNALMSSGDFLTCAADYEQAEAAYAAIGDALSVVRLQINRVFALTNLGEPSKALELAKSARQTLARIGQSNSVYAGILEMNAGVACRQSGRYEEALATYERGREIFRLLGNDVQMGRIDINRAKVLEKLDRFKEAFALVENARSVLQAGGAIPDVARADSLHAHLSFRCGRYREALDIYTRARSTFAALGEDLEVAATDYYRAQVYLALNLLAEAEELARSAQEAFVSRGMTRYLLQTLAVRAAAARGQGRLTEAAALFERAQAGLLERGEDVEAAWIDLQRAAMQRRSGQLQQALDLAGRAAQVLKRHGLAVSLAQAHLNMAEAHLAMKQFGQAAPLFRAAIATAQEEDLPALLYRAYYGLGRIAEAEGDEEKAQADYGAAIAQIESIHHSLRVDELQAAFMDDKMEVYEAAVRLALRQGRLEEAFAYVERAKSGALLDMLARGLELVGETGAPLLERLRSLRDEWYWHTTQSPEVEGDTVRSMEAARGFAVRDLEHRLAEAWRELRLAESHYAGMAGARRLALAEVQARLPDDVLLIEYYATEGNLLAFLIQRNGAAVIRLGQAAEVDERVHFWRFDVDSLRLMLPDLTAREVATAEQESRAQLQQLYRLLVAPLEDYLQAARRLLIVPCQSLYCLPMAALHDGQEYLGDRFDISYLPAASMLRLHPTEETLLANESSIGPRNNLVMVYSDAGRLAYTMEEGRQVAAVLAPACLLTEDEATVARLRELAPTCRSLHLAAHGVFRSDNPLLSWLSLADGPLTVHDLYTLRLPQDALVVLSACETGLGSLRGGDVLGLSHGLFVAGARALLLSLWAVDDRSTAELMVGFWQRLKTAQTAPSALRQSQRDMRERYRHPFFWAGFVLWGE